MIKQLIAAAALASVAAISHAAEPAFPATVANPFYAGVDGGVSKPDYSAERGSYGGFVGYTFAPNFAVEAGFRRLYTFDSWGAHDQTNQSSLSVVGTLPLTASLGLYSRLGVNQLTRHGSYDATIAGTDQHLSYSDRTTNVLGGIGLSYKLTNNITARVEAQRVTHDIQNYSAGVSYAF
jgi:opacity protein-like surface antigen